MADDSRLGRVQRAELAVFVSGVTSMGLEILAGRLVAPEFGSSIYTWGSIIGVFLTALGVGYWAGGKAAPRRASLPRLAVLLLEAALFVAFVVVAGDSILQFGDALPVSARYASVLPITLLFGPPVLLLGFVSPYAAELVEGTTGTASGRIYAVGTIGSIVGAFGATFFLVPGFDLAVSQGIMGVMLVATAAVVAPPTPRRVGAALGVLLLVGAAVAFAATGFAVSGTVVYDDQTEYAHLRVVDENGVRTMYLDGAPQSAMYLGDRSGYVFGYSQYLHVPMLVQEDVDRVLFIGGGGFSSPKRFVELYPNVTVDVAEIDPEVVRVAKEHFGVEEGPRMNIYVEGGRQFLSETNHTYDVIVLDAFRKDKVPFQLTTVQFMELAAAHLDENGMFVANTISAASGPGSAFFRAEYKTMQRAFPSVYAFPTTDTAFLQNIELLATKQPTDFTRERLVELARAREDRVGLDLTDEVSSLRTAEDVPTADVPVLRDDRAPVANLLDAQLGRRYYIDRNTSDDGNTTTASAALPAPRAQSDPRLQAANGASSGARSPAARSAVRADDAAAG